MEINQQAALVARQEIFIQAQLKLSGRYTPTSIPRSQWQPGIASSKLEGAMEVGAVFQWKPGGITINSTRSSRTQRTDCPTGTAIGTQAIHIWILKPHQEGTLLTTEESMDGWLTRALKVIMPRFLEESLDTWLQSLKKRAESS
jgi:hypothetical protein